MRRAERRPWGFSARAGLAVLTAAGLLAAGACGRQADAVPASAAAAPRASGPATPSADGPPAAGAPAAGTGTGTPAAGPPAGGVVEATSRSVPLAVRVVAVRRESPDSIRVELSLANLTPRGAGAGEGDAGTAAAAAVQAAVAALEDASVLSADGRRRMFALRDSTGARVGSPPTAPEPGRSTTFWTLFPAAEGTVSVLLPGFAPLTGLTVAASPGRPEP